MAIETLRIQFTNGEHIDVVPNLFDQRNFERTLRNNKSWGPLQDNALKLQAFKGWSAASRLGLIDLSWEEFYEDPHTPVHAVTVHDPEDDDLDADGESLEVEGVGKDIPAPAPTTSL